jgi:hypothetical protein
MSPLPNASQRFVSLDQIRRARCFFFLRKSVDFFSSESLWRQGLGCPR